MWWVPSGVERVKLSGPLVAGNQCKNLEKRMCKGMAGNGSNVKKRRRTSSCEADEFNSLKYKPPYRDIRHTLCEVRSTSRWERSKDTGRHNTLHFANFNQGMSINVGAILRGLITRFLRAEGIEKEPVDMIVAYHPDLTGNIVDVTMTKALDTSHGPVFDEEIDALADPYPLIESATFLCRSGPVFLEPLDDDEATADEAMDDEADVVDEEENALMVFDDGA
ncbi:hypothetical protein KY289_008244 [Solanum tuberosum]|nr:hypothetical protein KY289_008244 [Solanum tuberosum]